jgi:hypothetical protein
MLHAEKDPLGGVAFYSGMVDAGTMCTGATVLALRR